MIISLRICTSEFGYFISAFYKMPRKNLFKFLSRKFGKAAKEDDAPTYRKYFVPDFSFLERFDNMSVIFDGSPAKQVTVETVEEAREATRSNQEATVTPTLESETAENTSSDPTETAENTSSDPTETAENAASEPTETADNTSSEPETAVHTSSEPVERVQLELETEAVPLEPEAMETATVESVPTGMNPENWVG